MVLFRALIPTSVYSVIHHPLSSRVCCSTRVCSILPSHATAVAKFIVYSRQILQVVAVEPSESPVISGGNPGAHKIQGIGAGFVPKNLDTKILDEIIQVGSDCLIMELAC